MIRVVPFFAFFTSSLFSSLLLSSLLFSSLVFAFLHTHLTTHAPDGVGMRYHAASTRTRHQQSHKQFDQTDLPLPLEPTTHNGLPVLPNQYPLSLAPNLTIQTVFVCAVRACVGWMDGHTCRTRIYRSTMDG